MSGDAVTGIVEIPQGSRNKTEHDPELRRSSSTGLDNRAYVVDTPAHDGDPLDVLICVSEPTFPGCLVIAKPIGLFKITDERVPTTTWYASRAMPRMERDFRRRPAPFPASV